MDGVQRRQDREGLGGGVTIFDRGVPRRPPIHAYAIPSGPPKGRLETVVVEPTQGWWSGGSIFGREVTINPVQAGARFVVGNIDKLPGPPRPRCVQVWNVSEHYGDAAWIRRGHLVTGVGGVTTEVAFDWAHGCTLNVIADTLRVEFSGDAPYANGDSFDVGEPITVAVTIGEDPAPGANRLPTYTTPIVQVGTGSTDAAFWPVPKFARKVYPMIGGFPSATVVPYTPFHLQLRNSRGFSGNCFNHPLTVERALTGVPLGEWCDTVSLRPDGTTVNDALTSLVFELSL